MVSMKEYIVDILEGMEAYNPKNIPVLEHYMVLQSSENGYDFEANRALLKLYQLNPKRYDSEIAGQILLQALTNLPRNDFTLCKCLLTAKQLEEDPINQIVYLSTILEQCEFEKFWGYVSSMSELTDSITGFMDSIRKYICSVVRISYQRIKKTELAELLGNVDDFTLAAWIAKCEWKEEEGGLIFIQNHEDIVKPKNIDEKIDIGTVASIMALSP